MSTCFGDQCKLKAPQAWQAVNMSTPESETLQAIDALPVEKHAGGRPSTFTEAIGALICTRIAGGETLSAICKTPGLPATQTIYQWRRKNSQFDADYRVARVDQMESWADEILEIADDSTFDTVTKTGKNGATYEAVDHENIQRDRLRVDVRKFIMAKIAPRIYGDKLQHEHSGEIHQRHTVELSDRERMRRLATFMLEDRANQVIEGELAEPSGHEESQASTESQPDTVQASSPDSQEPDVNQ